MFLSYRFDPRAYGARLDTTLAPLRLCRTRCLPASSHILIRRCVQASDFVRNAVIRCLQRYTVLQTPADPAVSSFGDGRVETGRQSVAGQML